MNRKSGFSISFDKKFLETLIKKDEKGVVVEKCRYHIALHPAQLHDFKGALSEEVGKNIARYDKKLSGILLGFKNITPTSTLGHFGPDNIFIHLDVDADFFIFRPTIGMVLNGVVTKAVKDHVGCLVYNTFNVSLPKSASGPENDEKWVGSSAKPGQQVSFEIVFLDLESRLPYIRGKILSLESNSEKVNKGKANNKKTTFDLEAEVQELPTQTKKKKRKHSETTLPITEDIDYETATNDSSILNYDTSNNLFENEEISPPKKKKHKNNSANDETNEVNHTFDGKENNESPSKKKKHKKSSLNIDEVHNLGTSELPKKKLKSSMKKTETLSDDNTSFNDGSALNYDMFKGPLQRGEISPRKKKNDKHNSFRNETNKVNHTLDNEPPPKKKKHKKGSLNIDEEQNLGASESPKKKTDVENTGKSTKKLEHSQNKPKERRKSVSGSMISSINPIEEVTNISTKRRLSVDSNIKNEKQKRKTKPSLVDLANFDKTIDRVIQKFCSETTDLKSTFEKESKKKRQHSNLANTDKINSYQDLEKERQTLIQKVKNLNRRVENSSSGGNASDSSVEQLSKVQKGIKREFKTPLRETSPRKLLSRNDSDSIIEKIGKECIKQNNIKREPKTPVRDTSSKKMKRETKTPLREESPTKLAKNDICNGEFITDQKPLIKTSKNKEIKREIKTPIREIPKEPNLNKKSAKKDINAPAKDSQINVTDLLGKTKYIEKGVAGQMSDWEVEDFSQGKKVAKNCKNVEEKESLVAVGQTKKKKERKSNSFSLNEGDLDSLFNSPSVKLEPKTDVETIKKNRKKSLSRSIDFKDIKMEQNSDIDDVNTFSLKNDVLGELGLHTEIDLGIKEDRDVL